MISKKKNNRRDFIRSSFVLFGKGGLGLMASPIPASGNKVSSFYYRPNRVVEDVTSASVVQLAQMIREKAISSVDLVNAVYQRMEEVNPMINAVVLTCKERALQEAQKADKMLAAGKTMGALHGVPMTIKDSLDTAGVVSTGGTLGRKDYIPAEDATIVARLRAQGAILLGKTNTPEFTLSGTTANLVYGMTSNPYKAGYSPGGSSGGAGAIVAAGGSPFDIGSDFGGSIRGPAHFNGIAGIKPTTGLVPRTGHIVDYGGLFDAYQVLGPLARYVEDLKLILPIIMGPDQRDAAIHPVPWTDPDSVRIGDLQYAWFVDHGSTKACSQETREAIKAAVSALKTAGITLKEDAPISEFQEAEQVRQDLFSADGRAWVSRLAEKFGTKQTHPLLRLEDPSTAIPSREFTELVEKLDACRSKLLQWMQAYDILICPVHFDGAAPNPTVFERSASSADAYGYMGIFNLTGWPAAVVRAGTSKEGLPIGVQIVGQPFQDHKVLAVAEYLELQLGGWQMPAM
jgi:amidase